MSVFNKSESLGSLPSENISEYLSLIGDQEAASSFLNSGVTGQAAFYKSAYSHTGAIIGFIDSKQVNNGLFAVASASNLVADANLKNKPLKIALDCFYAANFPGYGQHNVLCEFSGKNQVTGDVEEIRQVLKFNINDKSHAAINGSPIFLGLNVGQDGISFEGRTINVSSDNDDVLMATFDTPVFKSGMALLATSQPIIKPFSTLAIAAISNILKRNKNKQVHNFNLGLDFNNSPSSIKLRLGSYVVIQSDDPIELKDFVWNQATHRLQYQSTTEREIDFNYLVIDISEFQNGKQSLP